MADDLDQGHQVEMLPDTSKDCIDEKDCRSTTLAPQGFIAAPKSTVIQRRRSGLTNGEKKQNGIRVAENSSEASSLQFWISIYFPPVNLLWQVKLHQIDMLDSQPSKMLVIILQTGLQCRSSDSPAARLDCRRWWWEFSLATALRVPGKVLLDEFRGNHQAWMISLVE